ncbi:MAG: tetratricopeptide repeat protein, partial [Dokdonella sp.]
FTTALRSIEWASPLTLSASDAAKRPNSSAAQYEYALVLLESSIDGDPEPLRRKAFEILERMSNDSNADAVHSQLLIIASAEHKLPIKNEWWTSMIAKLAARPVSSVDVEALGGLLACLEANSCPRDVARLKQAFEAATDHPGGYGKLFLLYGQFAQNFLGDSVLAEKATRRAIQQSPSDLALRANLAGLLINIGRVDEAERELDALKSMNHFQVLDTRISELQRELIDLQQKTKKADTSSVPALP